MGKSSLMLILYGSEQCFTKQMIIKEVLEEEKISKFLLIIIGLCQ